MLLLPTYPSAVSRRAVALVKSFDREFESFFVQHFEQIVNSLTVITGDRDRAMKRLPRQLWRWVHRSSFILYFVATYHAIAARTDSENLWFRMAALASVNIVALLTVVLILAARKAALVPNRSARARAPATSQV